MRKWLPTLVTITLFAGLAWSARNSSGTYTLPAGNPVVTGTIIASQWANLTMSDIATELSNSLDRQGRGAMLAELQLFSGSAAAPGIGWSAELGTGFYRGSTNDISVTDRGTQWAEFNPVNPFGGGALGAFTVDIGNLPGTYNVNLQAASLYGASIYGGNAGSATIDGGAGVVGFGGAGWPTGNSAPGTGLKGVGGSAAGNAISPGGNGVIGCGANAVECSEGIQFGQGIGVTGLGVGGAVGKTLSGTSTFGIGVYGIGGANSGGSITGNGAGGVFIASNANSMGLVASGGGTSIPGALIQNATPSTASTRYTGLRIDNGSDLLFNAGSGVVNPGVAIGFLNAYSSKHFAKAWANISPANCDGSTPAGINDGVNVSFCTHSATTFTVQLATGVTDGTSAVVLASLSSATQTGVSFINCAMTAGGAQIACGGAQCTSILAGCSALDSQTTTSSFDIVVFGTQ